MVWHLEEPVGGEEAAGKGGNLAAPLLAEELAIVRNASEALETDSFTDVVTSGGGEEGFVTISAAVPSHERWPPSTRSQ